MRKIWKYVKLNRLGAAKKDEIVNACYPNPAKNVNGKKDSPQIIAAAQDAKEGKCKLLVWREVEISDDWRTRITFGGDV